MYKDSDRECERNSFFMTPDGRVSAKRIIILAVVVLFFSSSLPVLFFFFLFAEMSSTQNSLETRIVALEERLSQLDKKNILIETRSAEITGQQKKLEELILIALKKNISAEANKAKIEILQKYFDQQLEHLQKESISAETKRAEIEDLQKKLEDRVLLMESSRYAKAKRMERIAQQRRPALRRLREDMKLYSGAQLKEIGSLYGIANKKWGTPETKESLKQLIAKYPKSNRAGCAVLYLGQMSEDGKEREDYLQKAIEQYGDCCYGDGVIVGAYARYNLAGYYWKNDMKAEAEKLFEEIKDKYPEAIDHSGNLLVDDIEKIKKFNKQKTLK